jgi:hypothetical protein
MITSSAYKAEIIKDHSVHYWVKRAIEELDSRDPVDACFNAKMVATYFEMKLKELHGGR